MPRPPPGGSPSVPVSDLVAHRCGGGSSLGHRVPKQPPAFRLSAVAATDAPLAALVGGPRACCSCTLTAAGRTAATACSTTCAGGGAVCPRLHGTARSLSAVSGPLLSAAWYADRQGADMHRGQQHCMPYPPTRSPFHTSSRLSRSPTAPQTRPDLASARASTTISPPPPPAAPPGG